MRNSGPEGGSVIFPVLPGMTEKELDWNAGSYDYESCFLGYISPVEVRCKKVYT
jgi:hypothetical protein